MSTSERGFGPRVLISSGATYIASNVDNRITIHAGGLYKVEHHYHSTEAEAHPSTQMRQTRSVEQGQIERVTADFAQLNTTLLGREEPEAPSETPEEVQLPRLAEDTVITEQAPSRARRGKKTATAKSAEEPRKSRRKQPLNDSTNTHEDNIIKIKQEQED